MKRKYMLLCLVLILFALIFANFYRFKQIIDTPELKRYIDRWTGIEWMKIHSNTGVSRIPAKFYSPDKPIGIENADILNELVRISNLEKTLIITWSFLTFTISILIVYNLIRYKSLKGSN